MTQFETMIKKQEELENLKKYLKSIGFNENSINDIANGNFSNYQKDIKK